MREDPESVWDDVRARVCRQPDDFAADLLDDLLFDHAEAFADRVAALADACSEAKLLIASLLIDDKPDTPALRRFEALRRRLEDELVAAGELSVWRREDDDVQDITKLRSQ